jgi:hypothetical protein
MTQNHVHKEIKSSLNSKNACYLSGQKILSSHLSINVKTNKIYKTVILLLFCMGVKLCLSLAL